MTGIWWVVWMIQGQPALSFEDKTSWIFWLIGAVGLDFNLNALRGRN